MSLIIIRHPTRNRYGCLFNLYAQGIPHWTRQHYVNNSTVRCFSTVINKQSILSATHSIWSRLSSVPSYHSVFDTVKRSLSSRESWRWTFHHCKDPNHLRTVVDRLFHKHSEPHELAIIAALEACARIQTMKRRKENLTNGNRETNAKRYNYMYNENRIDDVLTLRNEYASCPPSGHQYQSLSDDMKQYWLDVPTQSTCNVPTRYDDMSDDILSIAQSIMSRVNPVSHTIAMYNAYIAVCVECNRHSLAHQVLHQMRSSGLTPDTRSYKRLITSYMSSGNYALAVNATEVCTETIIKSMRRAALFKSTFHLGIGIFAIKWMSYGMLLSNYRVEEISIACIGMSVLMVSRVMMSLLSNEVFSPMMKHRQAAELKRAVGIKGVTTGEKQI
ncbi:9521_t:CDS:1 [Paraglomus occultum]|uniref:9521_t:CDS:1 n=1 Tax=Paraglomus occultum TaxID=144539 RepID=A0A9N9EW58_9GLOM|nr:9521_t:CDS:1 [Paraglomus occultum]